MKVIAAVLVLGALLLVAGPAKRAYDSAHIGAPQLVYQCPAGTFVKRWWVPAFQPRRRGPARDTGVPRLARDSGLRLVDNGVGRLSLGGRAGRGSAARGSGRRRRSGSRGCRTGWSGR